MRADPGRASQAQIKDGSRDTLTVAPGAGGGDADEGKTEVTMRGGGGYSSRGRYRRRDISDQSAPSPSSVAPASAALASRQPSVRHVPSPGQPALQQQDSRPHG